MLHVEKSRQAKAVVELCFERNGAAVLAWLMPSRMPRSVRSASAFAALGRPHTHAETMFKILERCSSTSSKKGIFRWPQHIQKDFLPKMPDDRLMLERLASAETERDNFHKQHFRSNQNWTMLHNLETSMTEQVKKDLSTWMAK